MNQPLDIRARCIGVPPSLRAAGLRCFAQVVVSETLFIDGLTVRVTEAGKAVVTWPERRDGQGRHHPVVRLLDAEARVAVEQAVLDEAVRGGWLDTSYVRAGEPTSTGRSAS